MGEKGATQRRASANGNFVPVQMVNGLGFATATSPACILTPGMDAT